MSEENTEVDDSASTFEELEGAVLDAIPSEGEVRRVWEETEEE